MSDKKDKETEIDSDDIVLEENHEDNSAVSSDDKVKKLKKEIVDIKKEKADLLAELQRAKADFINMRRRDEEHLKDMVRFANVEMISQIIPVLDSFDMAFSNKEAWEKAPKEWRIGVEYIYNQLLSVLTNNSVDVVNPIGQKFDPNTEEAIENIPGEKENDGKVVAVIQKGYKMGDRMIRPAKVKVGTLK